MGLIVLITKKKATITNVLWIFSHSKMAYEWAFNAKKKKKFKITLFFFYFSDVAL